MRNSFTRTKKDGDGENIDPFRNPPDGGNQMRRIFFVASAYDYHAFDWYNSIKKINMENNDLYYVTDLYESEGFENLVGPEDKVIEMCIIDRFLLKRQSRYANIWRNMVKILFVPFQVKKLKDIADKNPNAIFHALSMYYMFLCFLAGVEFIGTPQGSEVLVRPFRSGIYRFFAKKTLTAAQTVIVDSIRMQQKIFDLCGKTAEVVQFGIDTETIRKVSENRQDRSIVLSIRGMTPLYRIEEILKGRDNSDDRPPIHFIYPFIDESYKENLEKRFQKTDVDLGKLPKMDLFETLAKTKLTISIPISDSSPRSVYEAIFSGCGVAATDNPWIEALPECMRQRVLIVDINDGKWFQKAFTWAESLSKDPFRATKEATEMFDHIETKRKFAREYY